MVSFLRSSWCHFGFILVSFAVYFGAILVVILVSYWRHFVVILVSFLGWFLESFWVWFWCNLCVIMDSFLNHFLGVILGWCLRSFWYRFVSFCHYFSVILISFWYHFGIIFRVSFGIILASFWVHFWRHFAFILGVILVSFFGCHFGVNFGVICGIIFGVILILFLVHFVVSLGSFSGSVLSVSLVFIFGVVFHTSATTTCTKNIQNALKHQKSTEMHQKKINTKNPLESFQICGGKTSKCIKIHQKPSKAHQSPATSVATQQRAPKCFKKCNQKTTEMH